MSDSPEKRPGRSRQGSWRSMFPPQSSADDTRKDKTPPKTQSGWQGYLDGASRASSRSPELPRTTSSTSLPKNSSYGSLRAYRAQARNLVEEGVGSEVVVSKSKSRKERPTTDLLPACPPRRELPASQVKSSTVTLHPILRKKYEPLPKKPDPTDPFEILREKRRQDQQF